jgi:hypothetical protein
VTRQREREARGPTDKFKGLSSAMCKDNLMELATALVGKILVVNIKEHFKAHPEKKGWL